MTRWGLSALTITAFAARLHLLLSTPEPTGWDGYSYVVQLERLASQGRLHWPDGSWVTYFFAALHVFIPSAIVAVKVGASLLAAAVIPAAWRLGTVVAPSTGSPGERPTSPLAAVLLATWAAVSPTLTHLAGDFPKSLGLVAPVLLALGWRRADSRSTTVSLGVAALLGAVAHRLGAGLLLASAGGVACAAVLARVPARRVILGGVLLVAVFVVLSLALPNLLHPADLDRVQGQLQLAPHLPPPWPYFDLRTTHPLQQLELSLGWPAILAAGWIAWHRPAERLRVAALVAPVVLCILPAWRTDVLDAGYRFSLLTPVFAVPLLAMALPPARTVPAWSLLAALALTPASRVGFDVTSGPPVDQWRALIARIPRPLPELLIAPQGFNFLYDHETGHESLAWSPEPGLDRTRIGRLAWRITDGEWTELAAGLEPVPVRLGADVVFVREDVWEAFLVHAEADPDSDLHARLADPRNPRQVRPASLRRNH